MIEVTAAIIEKDGKVLIARRSKGSHMAGKWEFPGGKIEKDETPEDCLIRELREELSIETRVNSFFAENIHDYGDGKVVRLLSFRTELLSGELELKDHDEVKWVLVEELSRHEFAPADIPFVNALIDRA